MDGRGRLAHSLTGIARWRVRRATRVVAKLPRGVGIAATVAIVAASLAFGLVRGEHITAAVAHVKDTRDVIANGFGFHIASVSLTGQRQVSREAIFALTGVTGRASLLFLDVDAARERLKANPWIADATVIKFYPDRLQITIVEREPFAIWQVDRQVSVIAKDGTVLENAGARFAGQLPFVVGRGAAAQASAHLALLDQFPTIREQVRASIYVAQRRWTLRLRSGLDVLLPEHGPEGALERLVELDREKKILSRDIVAIDLRLADRVTVKLSDDAAKARAEALKAIAKPKKKGRDA